MKAVRMITLEIDKGTWRKKASCKTLGASVRTAYFFPPVGQPTNLHATKRRKLCNECPVKEECTEFAVINGLRGLWGNTNEKIRRNMKPRLELFGDRYSRPFVPVVEENREVTYERRIEDVL